jgi:Fe-S-cluster containining protein
MLQGLPMLRSSIPLPVLQAKATLVPCTECARCCRYVGVGINAPTTPRLATDVLWYLYHEQVSVYRDEQGEWSVMFETRCRNLGDDRLCGVYDQRPHICRGFDNTTCDVNAPGARALTFSEPAEFLEWLRAKRPRVYARLEGRFTPERWQPGTKPSTARARRAVARKARI